MVSKRLQTQSDYNHTNDLASPPSTHTQELCHNHLPSQLNENSCILKSPTDPGAAVHACTPATLEAEAGEAQGRDQPGQVRACLKIETTKMWGCSSVVERPWVRFPIPHKKKKKGGREGPAELSPFFTPISSL